MSELHGSRVLVTGATSGLGAAMAAALYVVGARVMVTGRDLARAEAIPAYLRPSVIPLRTVKRLRCGKSCGLRFSIRRDPGGMAQTLAANSGGSSAILYKYGKSKEAVARHQD